MDKPSPQDWMNVANDMRKVLNPYNKLLGKPEIPLLKHPVGMSTDAELDEYEKIVPGSKEQILQMAQDEMNHRLRLEKGSLKGMIEYLLEQLKSRSEATHDNSRHH